MARRLLSEQESNVISMVGRVKKKTAFRYDLKAALAEIEMMIENNEFAKLSPRHLPAYFAICHKRVYGIYPLELDDTKVRLKCLNSARSLVKYEFGDDTFQVLKYIRNTWKEEDARVEWLEKKGHTMSASSAITWWKQFCDKTRLTAYKATIAVKTRRILKDSAYTQKREAK